MKEIFAEYEINRDPRWQHLSRWIVASFALHTAMVACVVYIPAVRNMLEIAGMFSGADYVNEAYNTVAVGERAQVVDLSSPEGRFQYPLGYFSTDAPPVSATATATPTPPPGASADNAVIVSEYRPERASRRRRNRGAQPDALAQNAETPAASPTPMTEEQTQAALNQTATTSNVQRPGTVNTRPFLDLLTEAKGMIDRGELDLSGTIEITFEADRNDDGTLANVNIVGGETNNRSLQTLATRFVQTLSASRALSFLGDTRHLRMTLRLDQQRVLVRVASEIDTEARATQMAQGYSGLLAIERLRRRGRVEGEVWSNMQVSSRGREVNVNFEMPRNRAAGLLAQQLPQTPPPATTPAPAPAATTTPVGSAPAPATQPAANP